MTQPMTHLLVVDDDVRLASLLQRYLQSQGFLVSCCADTSAALALLQYCQFALIILDVRLPGESGLDLTQQLRAQNQQVPILLLTAESQLEARIEGFRAGADDYLTKPFDTQELLMRIQAILRRTQEALSVKRILLFGDCAYHVEQQFLQRAGTSINLTGREQLVLAALARHPYQVISRQELASQPGYEGSDRAIDALIVRLRRKLEHSEGQPRFLQTIHGQGYVLRPERIIEE